MGIFDIALCPSLMYLAGFDDYYLPSPHHTPSAEGIISLNTSSLNGLIPIRFLNCK